MADQAVGGLANVGNSRIADQAYENLVIADNRNDISNNNNYDYNSRMADHVGEYSPNAGYRNDNNFDNNNNIDNNNNNNNKKNNQKKFGGNAVNGANKAGVPQPHAILEQLPGVQYCINSPPPWSESVSLGFQHYIVSLGTTVLIPSIIVPLMGGGQGEKVMVIQSLLFVSGVNTLMQSFFGTRLPSVIGGSYAYLVPIISVIEAKRYSSLEDSPERFAMTMRGLQGALIVASCVQLIVGFLGIWRNFARFIFPLQMVPLISLGGLGLYYLGFPELARCVEIGVPALIVVVAISQYLSAFVKSKRPICDRYAVICSIAIIWVYAGILTWSGAYKSTPNEHCRTDRAGLIAQAPWVYFPLPFRWGPPTFYAGDVFAMVFAALVASTESTGAFLVAGRYGSATPVPPSVIGRGIGWMGIGSFLSGLLGGITGCTATMENAGLLALTKAGSRRVVQISAAFMIFFSILGKFGALFASVPLPIMGAIYCLCFGYASAAGLGFLQFCNLNSFRTKSILGISLFLGLSLPQYFREHQLISNFGPVHTKAIWFNDIMSVIFMSHATVGVVVAIILDCTLPTTILNHPPPCVEDQTGTLPSCREDQTRKDNGALWWERFLQYNKDVRSDEFYKLPFSLNKCFPPV